MTNTALVLLTQAPIPRDLDLPLPLGSWELQIILVLLFLVHIFFVNLMVGGSLLAVIFEIMGLSRPKYDTLAKAIAATITVNKSLAVVLGVGPLLAINLLYTIHFYTANALTGHAWISIVPLVIMAFLLTYLHKYTWEKWIGPAKQHHIILGGAATFLFLCIPFIFLANINLMLLPERWSDVQGFFSSLEVGNVFPRYFHFLTASVAITGLILAGWLSRKKYPVEEKLPEFTRSGLRRAFYRVAFYVTLGQLAFGPLVLVTLPSRGVTIPLLLIVLGGVVLAVVLLLALRSEIRAADNVIGRHYPLVIALFSVLVLVMGTGRHVYREASLAPHKALIADKSASFRSVNYATQLSIRAGFGAGDALASGPTGKSVFVNCAACHALDKVLAAPSLREVYSVYAGNPEGLIAWAKKPGKKRPEFTTMPSFAHLGDEQLRLVADYILDIAAPRDSTIAAPGT